MTEYSNLIFVGILLASQLQNPTNPRIEASEEIPITNIKINNYAVMPQMKVAYSKIVTGVQDIHCNELKERVKEFENITVSDWFKDVPNKSSIESSLAILDIFEDIGKVPENISASPDGSIIFNFFNENDFYVIEVYNTGEIVYLKRADGKESTADEVSLEKLKSNLDEDFDESGENSHSETTYGE